MMESQVEGMTCRDPEQAVTRAVRSLDPSARVTVDRKADQVIVESAAGAEAIRHTIEVEGYAARRQA